MSESILTNITTKVREAIGLLIGRGAKSSELAAGLADAREMERAALAELATAQQDHAEAIRTFDRERGLAALGRQEVATFSLAAAREAIGRLDAENRAALAAEEQSRLQAEYDATSAELAEAEEALIVEYPTLAHRIREIVRLRAEIDLRVEAVNKALPTGAARLQTLAERYFTAYGLAREELGTVEIDVWVRNGQVVPETFQKRFRNVGAGVGEYQDGRDTYRAERRRVRRTKFLPQLHGHNTYDGFANCLTLPGLAGEPSYFRPAVDDHPVNVLAQLTALEAEETAHRPPVRRAEFEDEILPKDEVLPAPEPKVA